MILVTGGSRGIGRACVDLLSEAGALVLYPPRGELDVSSNASWARFVDTLRGTPVTGLVNCAGISSEEDLEDCPPSIFYDTFAVNTASTFLGMKYFSRVMPESSSIVNVASIFAEHGGMGRAIAYQSSKAAVLAITRTAAISLAPKGIRVNAVVPGFVSGTGMTEGKGYDKYAATSPLGRMLTTTEVASVIVFLLSKAASGVTGAAWNVDGGWDAR